MLVLVLVVYLLPATALQAAKKLLYVTEKYAWFIFLATAI